MDLEDADDKNIIDEIPKIIGGWVNVPDQLKCKSDLTKMGLKPSGTVKAQVWNKYTWIDLYDVKETVPKSKRTDNQLKSLMVGRVKLKNARTCDQCRRVFNVSDIKNVDEGKFCKGCLVELGYSPHV